MSVYKRGNIWWVKFSTNGQHFRQSSRSTKKREAEQYEKALRAEVARRLHRGRTGKPIDVTYADALLMWIETGAPKSMYSHIRNTRPYLDNVPLPQVPAAAAQMSRDFFIKGLSVQTINRRLACVRRVLNLCFKEWNMLDFPLAQKVKLHSEKGLSREIYLSKQEVTDLVSAVDDEEARKVILIAANTGLRRSEVMGLTDKNWQPPNIVLTTKTKSGKARTVPLISELHPLMTLPFQLTMWELRKAFEQARKSIQRPDIRFHDLRHTFASWLIKDPDIPLTLVRDLLGHSSLVVTDKYSHLRGGNIDMLEKALGTKK